MDIRYEEFISTKNISGTFILRLQLLIIIVVCVPPPKLKAPSLTRLNKTFPQGFWQNGHI